MLVDSHAHASPYWFEPVEVLLFQMDRNGVDKTVLVQFFVQTDNSYILECRRKFPGRFAAVVLVDIQRADASQVLKQLVDEGAEGVRLRPGARSPGKDPLAIWRTCAELGLPVTCLGLEKDFASDDLREIVAEFPGLPVIIEHLGHPDPSELPPYDNYRRVLELARYPNTYIKVGGLGELGDRPSPFRQPPFSVVPPFIRMAFEAFGPRKMMWGSDYPPSGRREGYANTIRFLDDYLGGFCSAADKEWIFSKTALSLYKFK